MIQVPKRDALLQGGRNVEKQCTEAGADPRLTPKQASDPLISDCPSACLVWWSCILVPICPPSLSASFALQKILTASTSLNSLVEWKITSQEQACTSALPFPQGAIFSGSFLDSLLATAFHSYRVLELLQMLVTGGISSQLEQHLDKDFFWLTESCASVLSGRMRCKLGLLSLNQMVLSDIQVSLLLSWIKFPTSLTQSV